jgi:Na+:H+ antiporter, NhaA family
VSAIPFEPASRGVVFVPTRPFRLFVATETRSAIPLLGATTAALVWANSPWLASYEALWTTSLSVQVGEAELSKDLRHWVNDGLMTLFFLVVGLEISRQLKLGELRHWQMAAVPAAAALGGMAVPALLYLAFNAGGPAARGWAMAMSGDLAFALGVLALVGPRCPPQLRVFLLTLLLVGDIAAVTVVGLLYAEVVNILALAVVLVLRRVSCQHMMVARLHDEEPLACRPSRHYRSPTPNALSCNAGSAPTPPPSGPPNEPGSCCWPPMASPTARSPRSWA